MRALLVAIAITVGAFTACTSTKTIVKERLGAIDAERVTECAAPLLACVNDANPAACVLGKMPAALACIFRGEDSAEHE